MGNFTISTSLAADGTSTIHVRGDIDIAASKDLKAALMNEVRRRRPPSLVVDMLQVTFMDSTGLAALLSAQRAARGLGTSLVVREVSTFIERQLRMAGIYEVLTGHR
ncbi:STAS domain-containing protein [Micromonospora sp. U21]|uniref:STAS domain-containing protein n=1 Tax=Micromonospora sp. U21 TaxID=2824899 RepID=UPI001B36DA98|nr:STAS domain-containing protein [Micromonospora sp. U21]MBQ0904988.1 STAS domain-containing protein [Micromonospora sp. U21]